MAVVFVGNGDMFLEVLCLYNLDHPLLDLGHHILDLQRSPLIHRFNLLIDLGNIIQCSRLLVEWKSDLEKHQGKIQMEVLVLEMVINV